MTASSDNMKAVDWLMGADEAIHTVCLFWIATVEPDKRMRVCEFRQYRPVVVQAVSSVAPLAYQRASLLSWLCNPIARHAFMPL